MILFSCWHYANGQVTRAVTGTVVSESGGQPLPGVNIIVQGTTRGTSTDTDGRFTLHADEGDKLVFSFIGYITVEIPVESRTEYYVLLKEDVASLRPVTIVSTGYQKLPKERVNGSFVHIDQELVNRRVSTDLLSRLEDVTSSLIFNRNVEGRENDISIRGMSTINSNTQPLIIVDNFPYDGDINNINPNDVESVTVLKDAAAASIWGAQAGNGVIVITTKRGAQNQPMKISFNSNVTIADRPDLFYVHRMSSEDFVGVERMLFGKGYYASRENTWNNAPLTPGVELMIAHRDGLLSDAELAAQLESLGRQDARYDFEKYFYQKSVSQQYALNMTGGSSNHRYYLSAGWDNNTESLVGNGYDRLTLNFNNTWTALQEKLNLNAGIYYSENWSRNNNEGPAAIIYGSSYPLYPYARLRDENGNNLPIIKDYRSRFVEQAEGNGLLNWDYVPLDELNARENETRLIDYRINTSLNYRIMEGLNAEVLYQYWRGLSERRDLRNESSYYARNLVNQFSAIDNLGNVSRPVPEGGILDTYNQSSQSYNLRAQLNFSKSWQDHGVSALAGYEVREINSEGHNARYYGYDDELATSQRVDYVNLYEQYYYLGFRARVPGNEGQSSLTDRYLSYYANAAYTFKKRYSLSVSGRTDKSNIFGVRANQRGVPLWSTGLGWIISDENFYHVSWLPFLKLRTTFGYNGNINKRVSAFTTAYRLGSNVLTGFPYSIITNPPNPDLKWERIRVVNIGLDFESKNSRLNGSIEFFSKQGLDLIGTTPFPPSTGITTFTGNTASTQGRGVDVALNTVNIDGTLKWNTTFLFSSIQEKVTEYEVKASASSLLLSGTGRLGLLAPLEDKPLYGVYSYRWAGLDPETGDPRSFLAGVPSTDHNAIVTQASPETLVYHGPARPTMFGAIRNTVSWKGFDLSFNISYRLGYYFRNTSVRYSEVLSGVVDHSDYAKRWQQPGDEAITSVPSMPEVINYNRDDVYAYSEILVKKGDNIRLQDISLSYTLNKTLYRRIPLNRIQVYSYVNNLGMIWKSAQGNIDPDYYTMTPVRSVAFGVRLDF